MLHTKNEMNSFTLAFFLGTLPRESQTGDELFKDASDEITLTEFCDSCTRLGTDASAADSPTAAPGSVLRCLGKDLRKIAI